MTRPGSARQNSALAGLGVARQRRPQGPTPGRLVGADVPLLATLDALDHSLNVARLGRGAADPADDDRWRRLIVVVGAVALAVAADIRTADSAAVAKLYRAVVRTPDAGKED